jgi:predicted enzyme related to lactoylglutathione lyase
MIDGRRSLLREGRGRNPYSSSMAHAIDYVELAVDDLEEAKAFYAKALGWAFNDYGPDYAGIKDPTKPDDEFGGLNPHPASSRGDGVVALARTDDAEADLASVLAAGGRITVELHEYPGGRRFMFADPWGNVLGVYQPLE